MAQRGTIVQVSLSGGGVPKLPVMEAEVGELGITGDKHDDVSNHGGPERALCLFSIERLAALAAEGHAMAPGSTGENITTEGIDWDDMLPGTRLRLGSDVVIELTRYTTPCKTIGHTFRDGDFTRMSHLRFPGWSRIYARVLGTGTIRPGDAIEVVSAIAEVAGDARR